MSTITLEIYHGGTLRLSPTMSYTGGRKYVYDNLDPDYITVMDIIAFVKERGYNNYLNIWYKFKDKDLSTISMFESDKDVIKILKKLQKKNCIILHIFIEHGMDDEPEVLATTPSTHPSLLTLTPHSQIEEEQMTQAKGINIEEEMKRDQPHQVEEDAPEVCDKEGRDAILSWPNMSKNSNKVRESQARIKELHFLHGRRWEVRGGDPWKREVVDLNNQTCTCKVWDLIGIPCGHGVVAIYKMKGIPEEYVHPVYRTSTFMNAYTITIGPVPSEENWPTSNHTKILPPHYKTAPGRPKKARKRAADEPQNPFRESRKGATMRCGNCGSIGHNARGCKGPVNPNRKIYKKKKKKNSKTTEGLSTQATQDTTTETLNPPTNTTQAQN
ncbi:Glycoside hydrolase, family 47 [Senna tora]|uniref:Glycoside hydrolase, family 47 n=1 Tax=Senna tora TaxID=362788 RepID=A0A835CHM5_9FABA|nr:Glycoside hydrolase, family 47 [Senna tora]